MCFGFCLGKILAYFVLFVKPFNYQKQKTIKIYIIVCFFKEKYMKTSERKIKKFSFFALKLTDKK